MQTSSPAEGEGRTEITDWVKTIYSRPTETMRQPNHASTRDKRVRCVTHSLLTWQHYLCLSLCVSVCLSICVIQSIKTRNLAIANRSRVSCAHKVTTTLKMTFKGQYCRSDGEQSHYLRSEEQRYLADVIITH